MRRSPIFGRFHYLVLIAMLAALMLAPARLKAEDAEKPVQTGTKCMMWKVSSGKATVYLVGSMHLAKPEIYPLPKEMEEAFAKSDTLVVEVNINKLDQQKLIPIVMAKGMYTGDETLSGSIKKETYEKAKEESTRLGLPAAGIDKMKPWLLSLTLEGLEIVKLGLDPKLGIDKHFLDLAEKNEKKIEELESADLQLNMLAGFDAKTQEMGLAQFLEDSKSMKEMIDKMTAAWTAGDGPAMASIFTDKDKDYPELATVTQKVIYDRNGPMAQKVEDYLKGDKTVFVIAGCAHMVGEKGIVKLLKDDHFKVEQSPATRPQATAK